MPIVPSAAGSAGGKQLKDQRWEKMITSAGNANLKRIRELLDRSRARREQNAFIVEGLRAFRESRKEDILQVFVSESFHKEHPEVEGQVVLENIFRHLSDVRTPQGVLAVVRIPCYSREDMRKGDRQLYLLLEGIQDPGNLGTMLRTGEGAGVSGILMDRNTADIYSPKVVRSTMGSIFRVPFAVCGSLKEEIGSLKAEGVRVYAAALGGEKMYHEEQYPAKTAFLIGNEGRGLSRELLELADERIRIPMGGKVEALNAAVSASLLMYRYRTQRMAEDGE